MTIFMPDFLGCIRIISYLCKMRAVIQRVSKASVTINGIKKSEIGLGFLILLGVCNEDTKEDVEWLVRKVANLRVFDDEQGVMNRSMLDVNGEALVVSQFTLFIRGFLPAAQRGHWQACGHWRVWRRYESRTAERWSCYHLYGYKKQRVI